jgi:hypothetical protein
VGLQNLGPTFEKQYRLEQSDDHTQQEEPKHLDNVTKLLDAGRIVAKIMR